MFSKLENLVSSNLRALDSIDPKSFGPNHIHILRLSKCLEGRNYAI